MRNTEKERRRNSRTDELYDEIIKLVVAFEVEYKPSTPEQAAWLARMNQYVHTKLAQLRRLDGEKTGEKTGDALLARASDRAGIEVIANEPLSTARQDEKKLKWCAIWKRAAALIAEFEVEHATSDDSAWASRVAVEMRSQVARMQHGLQATLSETSSELTHTPPAATN